MHLMLSKWFLLIAYALAECPPWTVQWPEYNVTYNGTIGAVNNVRAVETFSCQY